MPQCPDVVHGIARSASRPILFMYRSIDGFRSRATPRLRMLESGWVMAFDTTTVCMLYMWSATTNCHHQRIIIKHIFASTRRMYVSSVNAHLWTLRNRNTWFCDHFHSSHMHLQRRNLVANCSTWILVWIDMIIIMHSFTCIVITQSRRLCVFRFVPVGWRLIH